MTTVKDFIQTLHRYPPNAILLLSKDPDGDAERCFQHFQDIWEGKYREDDTGLIEFHETEISGSPCVVLAPQY